MLDGADTGGPGGPPGPGSRPRIRVLPPELASQIAAGEVVERPASVVKELVENALDAGARRVDVLIAKGGREQIRVVDDGCGLTEAEVRLAIERHATSKLARLEDLTAIGTLGFRGEALPSIASVSRFTVTSRPAAALAGVRCVVEAGITAEVREVGCPVGTTVEVADLFYNIPARRKFLKTDRTEAAHVAEAMLLVALARPDVHFTLTEDGRRSLDLPRHPGLLERAAAALGRRGAGGLHGARFARDGFEVEVALGSPLAAVATAKNIYLLVNGRGVRDRLLLRMLAVGYGELLERGRYPVAVLHLRLPLGAVDVNVHPQKYEVRFADEKAVSAAVRRAVAEGVTGAPWAAAAGVGAGALGGGAFGSEGLAGAARSYGLRSPPRSAPGAADVRGDADAADVRAAGAGAAAAPDRLGERSLGAGGYGHYGGSGRRPGGASGSAFGGGLTGVSGVGADGGFRWGRGSEAGPEVPPGSLRRHRYLGQLFRTYLLFEGDGELLLLDQHAAHERVTYGRLKEALAGGEVKMQRLLFPVTVPLDPAEEALIDEHRVTLGRCGFDVEILSGRTAAVRGVPALLCEGDVARLFRDVVAELAGAAGSETLERALDGLVATMACHGSVRAGQWLGDAEVAALLEALDQVERSGHCPHGRPVVVRLGEGEIRKRFQRE